MVRLTYTLLTLALAALFVGATLILSKKGIKTEWVRKGAAIAVFVSAFLRYLSGYEGVYFVRGLDSVNSPFNDPEPRKLLTALAVLFVWFLYAAMLTTVIAEFYDFKTMKRIRNLFSLPMYMLVLIFFDTYLKASVGELTFASYELWMLIIESAAAIGLTVSASVNEKKIFVPKTKKDIGTMLYALAFAILAITPCYVLQAFFNGLDPNLRLYGFTEEHRIMIYFSVITPFIIYHALKNKSEDVKRCSMIYLSVSLMWVYLGRWTGHELLTDPTSWPLHLCNTAMFIIPLCLVFKMNRLFNFTLFINVLGAFMAMAIPGKLDGLNAIGTERVSFWVNHYAAFAMPLLLVALGLFKRPKFKEWVYSVISFVCYFGAVLFINPYFTAKYGGVTDFFFLNDDFVVSKLGRWAEKTRDITAIITVDGFELTFYPLYQLLFFLVYIGFSVAIWFLYELLFASWDAANDRRLRERDYKRMKKELNEFLGGRSIHEPVSGDASPRLILRHFSKRYGSNKHYSVNDVSFEVKGGEIFGFLGPNGAGKSTIIKSMVGIQTITSGDIEICGFNVDKQPVQAKLHTGFVPDHYALYENLTGREYINYIADLFQVGFDYRNEVIEKLVERFQLTGSFDNQMKTYSHGMKQKITIMAALVHNPKVWILDEPLTGLDPTSIHEVKECMKEHAAKGNIVFFSSHIIDVVEKICDRIAIIKKGKLRACTTIKELDEKGIELEQFYLSIINDGDDELVPFVENAVSTEEA